MGISGSVGIKTSAIGMFRRNKIFVETVSPPKLPFRRNGILSDENQTKKSHFKTLNHKPCFSQTDMATFAG